ncbi:hypothetical protein WA158_007182 [Blastocystis sp. Blastoise]
MKKASSFGNLIITRRNGEDDAVYPIVDHVFIGRSKNCQLIIKKKSVSKVNTLLLIKDNKVYLKPLSEKCPTKLNGTVMTDEILLKNDDIIEIGGRIFKFKTVPGSKKHLKTSRQSLLPDTTDDLDITTIVDENDILPVSPSSDLEIDTIQDLNNKDMNINTSIHCPFQSPQKTVQPNIRRLSSLNSSLPNSKKISTSIYELLKTPNKVFPSSLSFLSPITPSSSLQYALIKTKQQKKNNFTPIQQNKILHENQDNHENSIVSEQNSSHGKRAIIIKKKNSNHSLSSSSLVSPIKCHIVKTKHHIPGTPLSVHKLQNGHLPENINNAISGSTKSSSTSLSPTLLSTLSSIKNPSLCITRTRTSLKEGLHPDLKQQLLNVGITPSPKQIPEASDDNELLNDNIESTSHIDIHNPRSSFPKEGLPLYLKKPIEDGITMKQQEEKQGQEKNPIIVNIPDLKYYYIDDTPLDTSKDIMNNNKDKQEIEMNDNNTINKKLFDDSNYEYIETIEEEEENDDDNNNMNELNKENNQWTNLIEDKQQFQVYNGDIKEVDSPSLQRALFPECDQETNSNSIIGDTLEKDNMNKDILNNSIHNTNNDDILNEIDSEESNDTNKNNGRPSFFDEYYMDIKETPIVDDEVICVPMEISERHSILDISTKDENEPIYLKYHTTVDLSDSDTMEISKKDASTDISKDVSKESQESKESNESNESKESNESNESNESKESNESNESKESKELKELKELKESKESKESKQLKDRSPSLTPCCCICHDSSFVRLNKIITCSCCHHNYHKQCAGLKRLPDANWTCKECQFIKNNNQEKISSSNNKSDDSHDYTKICELCHNNTFDDKHIGVVCSLCNHIYHETCLGNRIVTRHFICNNCKKTPLSQSKTHESSSSSTITTSLIPMISSETITIDKASLMNQTVADLRKQLKQLHAPIYGVKIDIVDRLYKLLTKQNE